MVVASPVKLHIISSRSLRRTLVLSRSLVMHQPKVAFQGVPTLAADAYMQGSHHRLYPNTQFGRWRRSDSGSSGYLEGDLRQRWARC